jgi:hypothetical protein
LPIDPHAQEVDAYRRLKARGLCDKGWIPQFYGTMENIQLDMFPEWAVDILEEDEACPSAIFIEYIPDMQWFEVETYTKDRMPGSSTLSSK